MMEPEQQKEHPKDDVEEMDTEHGGDTAPTADSDESKVTPKERSKAWKNFKRTEDGNKAKCNHCGQLVTIRSPSGVNTSTMLKHMLRCKKLHPELEVETVAVNYAIVPMILRKYLNSLPFVLLKLDKTRKSLKHLAAEFLGADTQNGEHCPINDARAAMLTYQKKEKRVSEKCERPDMDETETKEA
ncbi:hypothetical protein F2Q69_00003469 [Brassica cretica]|uniref:BED-type domain-containing protein n=1 Tax=Brassica cretica TaxID=69181 RepID=A0A8S9P6L5_BRACR|nr:hypothetical protein F2Q69_00003469 [Brassica cretica]